MARATLVATCLFVAVFLLAGTGTAGGTEGCQPIGNSTVITTSGCYELTENVTDSPNETYVEIRASDVILDGRGYTLDGSDRFDTIGVHVNGSVVGTLSNVTVRNVTATDWETGIYFRNVTGGVVHGVSARSSYHQGIQIRNSANVLLEDIVTADNPSSYEGVLVADSAGLTIENLTSEHEGMGIQLYDVSGATIANSTFREGSDGIELDDSGDVVIRDNGFENGGAVSSSGTGTDRNHVTNNTVTGDQRDGYCGGFSFRGAEDDVVANNTLDGCYRGMYVRSSFRLTIENNHIDNDPTYGNNNNYGIQLSAGAGHTLVNNTVTNSGTPGWDEPGIALGSTEHATLSGNTMVDNPVNLRVRGNSWSEVKHDIDSTNTVEGRPVYYYVNGSAGSVTVPTDAGWVGLVGTVGATIADVSFPANNQENAYLWGTDDTVIRNVTASGSRYAVWADNGNDDLVIEDSTFDTAGGIFLHRSTDSLVSDTAVINSGGNGFDLYRATGTSFENVSVLNSDAHGIQLKADSDHVSIANSTIRFGDRSAVYTAQNTNLSITNSTITDNGGGGVLESGWYAANTTIRDSVISNNDGNGVRFDDNAENATIVGNEISGNTGDGVAFASGSRDTRIAENDISDNGGYGIDLGGNGHGASIVGNVIAGSSLGLDLSSSFDNLTVHDNSFDNTQNVDVPDPAGLTNASWNATNTSGTNVVGGPYLGGNFWGRPAGDGFSQTCTDADFDGLCDAPFGIAAGHEDSLPLATPPANWPSSPGTDDGNNGTENDDGNEDAGGDTPDDSGDGSVPRPSAPSSTVATTTVTTTVTPIETPTLTPAETPTTASTPTETAAPTAAPSTAGEPTGTAPEATTESSGQPGFDPVTALLALLAALLFGFRGRRGGGRAGRGGDGDGPDARN